MAETAIIEFQIAEMIDAIKIGIAIAAAATAVLLIRKKVLK